MDACVSLQLVHVRTGVAAVSALIGPKKGKLGLVLLSIVVLPFASVRPQMSLQLAQFHGSVIAMGALVGLLLSVLVPHMSHHFARGRKRSFAQLASMRFDAGVGVDVVLQRIGRLESLVAYAAEEGTV